MLAAILVLYVGAFAIYAIYRATNDRPAPCARCGDPQGEGACESADCIVTPSGYGLAYVPSERDIAEGYIHLLEQEAR